MPNQDSAVSPFETITSKKSGKISKRTIIITVSIFVFLSLGVIAGVLLVKQQQNVQEKAAGSLCPNVQACPVAGQEDLLRNCNPANADGSPQEISCSNVGNVGQIATCGPHSFCCPLLGASWTTDLTSCTSPSPTPTATPTPTETATASASPTATASVTSRVQTSPLPVPVTGTDWPTILGAGIGGTAIIGAILLVL